VRDVQWSGNVGATTEHVYYSGTPFIRGTGHVSVAPDDYFTLSKAVGTSYQLKQHGSTGSVKTVFAKGEVKANEDVILYIVDGWYGTVITKENLVSSTSSFSGLEMNPTESLVAEACAIQHVHPPPMTTAVASSIEVDPNMTADVEFSNSSIEIEPNMTANMEISNSSFHVHPNITTAHMELSDSSVEVDPKTTSDMEFSIITIRLPKGHTSKGLRRDHWGFNNFLAYNENGVPMQIIDSSSGAGDLRMMNGLWLHKDHEYFWAKVESNFAIIACTTQGAHWLNVSVEGAKRLQFISPAVHWSDQAHRDGGEWSSAHNRPDHFREWAYNVITISNELSSRFSKFSEIVKEFKTSSIGDPNISANMEFDTSSLEVELGLCGKINPNRVRDVQWSGNVGATTEHVYYSGTPFIRGTGHVSVAPDDYFTLSKAVGTSYQLKQHGSTGSVKTVFAKGEVKANADVIFYIVDGWYGTVITKENLVTSTSSFSGLEMSPAEPLVAEVCRLSTQTTTSEPSEPHNKVRGVLHLSMTPIKADEAYLDIDANSATRTFLSDAIADAYGFRTVSILSINLARRLRATGLTKLHVEFEGVGLANLQISQSGLSYRIQQHFEPYGWKIESASIELKGQPDRNVPSDTSQPGVRLLVIGAVAFGALCSMVICGIFFVWRRHTKSIPTNTVTVVPKVDSVDPNPCIFDTQPVLVIKKADTEAISEPSTDAPSFESSNTSSSEDLNNSSIII